MTHTPAPAEIETLRKIVAGRTCTEHDQRAAVAILDRLSPPEPEQPDEATVWTRKVLHAEYQITAYATGEMDDRAQFINARQVLSELIASKDAEADAKVKYAMDRLNEAHANKPDWERLWAEQTERAEKAESKLAALRAENEPPEGYTAVRIAAKDLYIDMNGLSVDYCDGWYIVENKRLKVCPEAAERNPAEPDKSVLAERALGQIPAPVVEVTQADRDVAADFYCDWFATGESSSEVKRIRKGDRDGLPHVKAFARHRTEAEARGRRQALEEIKKWLRSPEGKGSDAGIDYADGFADQIERMMTGEK